MCALVWFEWRQQVLGIEQYGKIVKSYSGTGELVGEDMHMPAAFRFAQYAYGKIYLRCVLADPLMVLSDSRFDAESNRRIR